MILRRQYIDIGSTHSWSIYHGFVVALNILFGQIHLPQTRFHSSHISIIFEHLRGTDIVLGALQKILTHEIQFIGFEFILSSNDGIQIHGNASFHFHNINILVPIRCRHPRLRLHNRGLILDSSHNRPFSHLTTQTMMKIWIIVSKDIIS